MGKSKTTKLIIALPILILVLLNFIAVFTPEIGFDALWYHLTLPKLYLLKKQYFFPGGLLYYSVMPRLTELLFIPLIHFTGTVGPKMLQFLSGLGICLYIWKIGKKFQLSKVYRLIGVSMFYCTWLVSWESSSAYIDLFRALLETSALYFFLTNKKFMGGILLGLALGTKWLTLFSVLIYTFVFGWGVLLPVGLVSFPWFLIAYFFTKNPVYPLFNPILQNGFQDPPGLIKNLLLAPIQLTLPFDDFISPLIGLLFIASTFGLFFLNGTKKRVAIIAVLGSLSTLILSPPSARFLLPYLPALIVSSLMVLSILPKKYYKAIVITATLSAYLIIAMRIFAFKKYLPFLLGHQNTNQYLESVSSRLPDTFIDTDDYIQKNLPYSAKYIINNLHNLYYFPYDFDHSSWAKGEKKYDFLITKNESVENVIGELIHINSVGVQVFKLK